MDQKNDIDDGAIEDSDAGTQHPPATSSAPSAPSAAGVGALRKKIRDMERLLARPSLPSDVRHDVEKRLREVQAEVDKKNHQSMEQQLQHKYKYVKHIERTKVLRKVNQLEKKLGLSNGTSKRGGSKPEQGGDENVDEIKSMLDRYRLLLAYIEFFPVDMKYVSLFPKTLQADQQQSNASDGVEDDDAVTIRLVDQGKRRVSPKSTGASSKKDPSASIRDAVLDRVRHAKESGELLKEGFILRLADVFEGAERRKLEGMRDLLLPSNKSNGPKKGPKSDDVSPSSKTKQVSHNKGNHPQSASTQVDGQPSKPSVSHQTSAAAVAAPSPGQPEPKKGTKSKEAAKQNATETDNVMEASSSSGRGKHKRAEEFKKDDFFLVSEGRDGDGDAEGGSGAADSELEELTAEDADAGGSKRRRRKRGGAALFKKSSLSKKLRSGLH